MDKAMSTSLPTMPSSSGSPIANGTNSPAQLKEGGKKKSMSSLLGGAARGVKVGNLKKKGYFGQWKERYFSLDAGNLLEYKDSKAKKAERAIRCVQEPIVIAR